MNECCKNLKQDYEVDCNFLQWQASHEGAITSCNYSSDSKYIVSGGDMDYSISIWDADDGKLLRKLKCE